MQYAMMQWRKGEKTLSVKCYIIVGDLNAPEGWSGRQILPDAANTLL
jgi:hypothetical protein